MMASTKDSAFLPSAAITLVLTALLLVACGGDTTPGEASEPLAASRCVQLPAGSRLPRFGAGSGRLLLSYVMQDDSSGDRLHVRELVDGVWGSDRMVSSGDQWFINWADYPSVKPFGDSLFYHYLVYSGEGTYDYNIHYGTGSEERGVLHNDGVAAEHGFVSSAHLPGDKLQLTWLDGRKTKIEGSPTSADHGHHGGGEAMTLRTATLSAEGAVSERKELDERVCDCCNTATVVAGDRTMVAYRDRSESEIRDIAFVSRVAGGEWSAPRPVHADNWEVTGCPVNGPALAANEAGDIGVTWYTAAGGMPRIQFARYNASRDAFDAPIVLDGQDPLGRVDIKLGPDGTAYVTGLSSSDDPETAAITLWTITPDGSVDARRIHTTAPARNSGFPRLALHDGELLVAWTNIEGDEPVVEVCRVDR
ncbi:hypothetical protein GGR28_000032 [Lewinella aquimaris]|uniref:Uncharacterized protein n=1 Tax=Neolewinella aquimaris TaxID=1835722 RepID=A0A840DWP9_9BACT|nr:exo-alpha-sialidase [Neolewinella aquimaris]MBB4077431.1 hypothetical protein [Neolewinella aquimaris]